MQEYFVDNNGVNISYKTVNLSSSSKAPSIVFIHGALGSSDDWTTNSYLMKELSNAKAKSLYFINLRGRGNSDCPKSGFTVEDHISDIVSVIEQEKLNDIIFVTHSLGVPFAIGYALQATLNIMGVVVGDYVALVPPFHQNWLDTITSQLSNYNVSKGLPYHLYEEIKNTSYIDQLEKIKGPFLIIRGKDKGVLSSEQAVEMWSEVKEKSFFSSQTGHDVFENNETVNQVMRFINEINQDNETTHL